MFTQLFITGQISSFLCETDSLRDGLRDALTSGQSQLQTSLSQNRRVDLLAFDASDPVLRISRRLLVCAFVFESLIRQTAVQL
jgi:hypothetical protein